VTAAPQLAAARGFMFDIDGTLIHRGRDGSAEPIPGAREVLEAIRGSGRPLVAFTNGSHVAPEKIAAGIRAGGLDLADNEVLTPVCSAITHLRDRHAGKRVVVFGTEPTRARIADAGIDVVGPSLARSAEVVLVVHVDDVSLPALEAAAHAVIDGASFYAGSYVRAYAGADGPILSRGAMAAAAIAKVTGRRPTVIGKPSRAAVREVADRLGVPPRDVAFVGDDVGMDIALGRMAKARTVLVATGISGGEINAVPPARRPDVVLNDVSELLPLL
jgi:NagD protein